MIQPVHIHMIKSQICGTQIMVVSCHLNTIDMRPEIPLCNTAQSLMINLFRDLSDPAVFSQTKHCDLAVMITAYKKEFVFVIRGQITSPHTVDAALVNHFQITAGQNLISLHTEVCDRIQKLAVMGNRNIGGIGDLHLVLLSHSAFLHIHVIDLNAVVIFLPHRISRNICHIFPLTHIHTIPFFIL